MLEEGELFYQPFEALARLHFCNCTFGNWNLVKNEIPKGREASDRFFFHVLTPRNNNSTPPECRDLEDDELPMKHEK